MKKILMMVFAEPGFREEFPAHSLQAIRSLLAKTLASLSPEKRAV